MFHQLVHSPKWPTLARAGSGWSQEPHLSFPSGLGGRAPALGLSSMAFRRPLVGSCVGIWGDATWTSPTAPQCRPLNHILAWGNFRDCLSPCRKTKSTCNLSIEVMVNIQVSLLRLIWAYAYVNSCHKKRSHYFLLVLCCFPGCLYRLVI